MRSIAMIYAACCCLAGAPLSAQEAGNAPRRDPIGEQVLPPELIMQHQKAIALSEAQKNAVIGEIKRTQVRMVDVQWDLQRALESMVDLLKQDKADEQKVLTQLDKVLAVEREIKRAHIGLAVRLKNILSPEQQRTLRELRASPAPSGSPVPQR